MSVRATVDTVWPAVVWYRTTSELRFVVPSEPTPVLRGDTEEMKTAARWRGGENVCVKRREGNIGVRGQLRGLMGSFGVGCSRTGLQLHSVLNCP